MNRSLGPRRVSRLSESSHRRLLTRMSSAATAAGVGMLTIAPPSDAEIVYTPTHRVIKESVSYKLDLNHDGVVDFTLKDFRCGSCGAGARLSRTGRTTVGARRGCSKHSGLGDGVAPSQAAEKR